MSNSNQQGSNRGFTLWFTGLSGAGKSTLSVALAEIFHSRNRNVEIMDGDEIRENLSKGLGFSKEDRDTNIRRIGYVCHLLSRNGVIAISAAISSSERSTSLCNSLNVCCTEVSPGTGASSPSATLIR